VFFRENHLNSIEEFLEIILTENTKFRKNAICRTKDLSALLRIIIESEGRFVPDDEQPVDETRIRYMAYQDYQLYQKRLRETNHKYPISVLAEYLMGEGFAFVSGYAGGGIDEISHTGDKAYSVDS